MNETLPYLLIFGLIFLVIAGLLIRTWIKHNPNVHMLYKVKTVLAACLGFACIILEFTR